MAIYALGDLTPSIHPDAFVHPDAVIIGDVTIGQLSSIWPCAVLRGDSNRIIVGDRTSIQDGAVIHVTNDLPTVIGSDCTVGHNAHLEGCHIHDGALVGSGALVHHAAIVHTGALVAAGAVVTHGTVIPHGALAVGVPARIKLDAADQSVLNHSVETYIENAKRYPKLLRRID
jgi:carbonic anhydrase/acetyltransferase-like protein (isoleucine patch superfamily)